MKGEAVWISDEEGRLLAIRLECAGDAAITEACRLATREIRVRGKGFILRKVMQKRGEWWAAYRAAPKRFREYLEDPGFKMAPV